MSINLFIQTLMQISTWELSDIKVSGYISKNNLGFSIFHPMYDRIYFIFENTIYELYITKKLTMGCREIPAIQPWFEVDSDDEFALSSIYTILFKTEENINFIKIDYQENHPAQLKIIYSLGNKLDNSLDLTEHQLIIDPVNFFGFSFYHN